MTITVQLLKTPLPIQTINDGVYHAIHSDIIGTPKPQIQVICDSTLYPTGINNLPKTKYNKSEIIKYSINSQFTKDPIIINRKYTPSSGGGDVPIDYKVFLPLIKNFTLTHYIIIRGEEESREIPYPKTSPSYDVDVSQDVLIKVYYKESGKIRCIKNYHDAETKSPLISSKITYVKPDTYYKMYVDTEIEGYTCVNSPRPLDTHTNTSTSDLSITFYYKKDPIEVGGQDATTDSENTYETTNTSPETALTDSNVPDYSVSNLSKWKDRSDTYGFGCYFIRYEGGEVKEIRSLPVFPQEFSDTNSAEFNATSVLGRSVAYQTYNTSSRTVSFALTLHEEVVKEGVSKYYWSKQVDINNLDTYPSSSDGTSFDESSPKYNKVREIVAQIQAACYPEYKEGVVVPPEVEFVIGNQFSIRGILTSCGATWKPPIINGNYVCCDLSIGITETTGPYSSSDVVRLKGKRGSYNA